MHMKIHYNASASCAHGPIYIWQSFIANSLKRYTDYFYYILLKAARAT